MASVNVVYYEGDCLYAAQTMKYMGLTKFSISSNCCIKEIYKFKLGNNLTF